MKHFILEHIIDNEELEKRIEQLVIRYRPINGWGEKEPPSLRLMRCR